MKAVVHDILTYEDRPLQSSEVVVFGEGDLAITVMIRDGVVEVSGHGPIVVMPRVSNVVNIIPAPR